MLDGARGRIGVVVFRVENGFIRERFTVDRPIGESTLQGSVGEAPD
jgi:hypothetical protein